MKMGDNFSTVNLPITGQPRPHVKTDINNNGQIAGTYFDEQNRVHGFLTNGNGVVTINVPFPDAVPGTTIVVAVNDAGQAVGRYDERDLAGGPGATRGFLFHDGIFTRINVPDSVGTAPDGINNAGQIVGSFISLDFERTSGFVLDQNGNFTRLDAPFPNAGRTIAKG